MNRVFDQALMAYNKETKKLDDLYRSAAKNCGMAECAFWILYTLRVEEKSFTQAEICEFLVEPKQTVNSALKKLVAEGYLALSAGTDQRSKLVRLTPKGDQLARERVDRIPEAEAAALRAMSPDDCAAFLRLTRQYRRTVFTPPGDASLPHALAYDPYAAGAHQAETLDIWSSLTAEETP